MVIIETIRLLGFLYCFVQPLHIAFVEQTLSLPKRATDFMRLREIGRSFFVLRNQPRCRSPPLLKSRSTKILENGGLQYGNKIFQKERSAD